MRENMIDASKLELQESIVNIRRVAKTVKGGRNMRFSVSYHYRTKNLIKYASGSSIK